MTELIDTKTYVPKHQVPTTISEVIESLQRMQDEYGDLPVELCTHTKNGVMFFQDIFYGYNTYDDGSKNISIQSFPY